MESEASPKKEKNIEAPDHKQSKTSYRNALTWSIDLIGTGMIGPFPLTTSNSMPSAGRGVRMSENMMTPSGLNALQGCRDSSMAISEVSDRSLKPILSEYLQRKDTKTQSCLLGKRAVVSQEKLRERGTCCQLPGQTVGLNLN